MTVGELKKLAPLANVYELNSESRYLMIAEGLSDETCTSLTKHMGAQKVYMAVLLVQDVDTVKIMDLEAKR